MNKIKLGAVDARFADIIWNNAPITTGELVKKCAEALDWKRTTVYTALKKFCDNEIFKTENGTVSVLISRDELHSMQSTRFVNEVFDGSLPAFIASFASGRKLRPDEITEIQKMINDAKDET